MFFLLKCSQYLFEARFYAYITDIYRESSGLYHYLAATFSDHNPLKTTWNQTYAQKKNARWRFGNDLLKDPEFLVYMNTRKYIFLKVNQNSVSHAIIWESLKAYLRGVVISYEANKLKERSNKLKQLQTEIRTLENEHANGREETLNIFNTITYVQ